MVGEHARAAAAAAVCVKKRRARARSQPWAGGAKMNYATQTRGKCKRSEWGGIGTRVLLALALCQRRSCPRPRASLVFCHRFGLARGRNHQKRHF